MNTAHNITPITARRATQPLNRENASSTVILSKDQWLGACLDDYLFKLCGTDQVVWIPVASIRHAAQWDHAFAAEIDPDTQYSCARITISNPIRLCLIDQHQVTGEQLLPFLKESR
ncbi:hypothetical protein [Marinicella meishanensis]|uniref:hypothetical protein n=1 Tax=Marinicella meishanensis TaxID=2873263 RepID=UPI001CC14FC0|nr:hypothetical protein [Marinicella sp. NBU2979]